MTCAVEADATITIGCIILQIMDGFQATKEILALGYTGVLVGVTANALSTDVQEFMQQGVHGVVTKPVNVAQLLDVIEMNVSISPHLVLPAGAGGRTPDE
jgi:CheY-like chemotaxis protein